jgi:hypothetical protein
MRIDPDDSNCIPQLIRNEIANHAHQGIVVHQIRHPNRPTPGQLAHLDGFGFPSVRRTICWLRPALHGLQAIKTSRQP